LKADILAAQNDIALVVKQAVEETCNTMLRVPVLNAARRTEAPDKVVQVNVKMNHGTADIDFYFRFDLQLLSMVAAAVFAPEYLKRNPVVEDIGCEVANIVCHKVKAFLNEEGYVTEMGFPFVPGPEVTAAAGGNLIDMHFFYRDKDARQRVGVAVNSVVA
jgi:hypothetical protein